MWGKCLVTVVICKTRLRIKVSTLVDEILEGNVDLETCAECNNQIIEELQARISEIEDDTNSFRTAIDAFGQDDEVFLEPLNVFRQFLPSSPRKEFPKPIFPDWILITIVIYYLQLFPDEQMLITMCYFYSKIYIPKILNEGKLTFLF